MGGEVVGMAPTSAAQEPDPLLPHPSSPFTGHIHFSRGGSGPAAVDHSRDSGSSSLSSPDLGTPLPGAPLVPAAATAT